MSAAHRISEKSPQGTESCFNDAVGLIYEAALEPALWPETIKRMVDFVGNSGTHLLLMDESDRSVIETVHFGMPDELMEKYNGEVVKTCPRLDNALSLPMNQLLFDYQHIPEHEIDHNEYYDWLQDIGDSIRYYLALRFPVQDGLTCYQSLAFRASEGHSQEEHWKRFGLLLPHLQRSVELSQRIGGWRRIAQSTLGLLEQVNCAVAILDSRGLIATTNTAFEHLCNESSWITARKKRPTFFQPRLQLAFDKYIRQATETSAGNGRGTGGTLHVEHKGYAYEVTVSPLRDVTGTFSLRQPVVAVFITEPDKNPQPTPEQLRERFGLTPAEARLASELVAGLTLKEAAKRLNVSIHTTRTQLKALFAKTSTRRQADLIRALLPAVFFSPPK